MDDGDELFVGLGIILSIILTIIYIIGKPASTAMIYGFIPVSPLFLWVTIVVTIIIAEYLYHFVFKSKDYLSDKIFALIIGWCLAVWISLISVETYLRWTGIIDFLNKVFGGFIAWLPNLVPYVIGFICLVVLIYVNIEIKKYRNKKKKRGRK